MLNGLEANTCTGYNPYLDTTSLAKLLKLIAAFWKWRPSRYTDPAQVSITCNRHSPPRISLVVSLETHGTAHQTHRINPI